MKLSVKHLLATLSMLTVLAVTPTTALAKGSVHIDVPGFSIGVHDDYYYRNRSYSRKSNSRRYNNYYNDNRYERRRYRQSRNRYYNNRRYNDNYYSGGRQYDRRYDRGYDNGYRAEVCPIDGYSRYDDRNRNCYEHKGHFHCS